VSTKRLNIELPSDQYDFLRKEASSVGTSVSAIVRHLVQEHRLSMPKRARRAYKDDPLYQRRGSFEGPSDLATTHDDYLYGKGRR
jgi:hypothetical protein